MKKSLSIIFLLFCCGLVSQGQVTWEKLFSKSSTDAFRSIKVVPSGGYIVAGYTADFNTNDSDAYAVRLTVSGDTSWTFTYNGPMSLKDLFYKVIPTADGGFAFCGYSTSFTGVSEDAMVMKISASGVLEWVRSWGGSGRERAQDIIELPSGNFAVVGYTTSSPAQYYDAFLLMIDNAGNISSTKRYGSIGYDDANVIQQLSDGGFILGGQSFNGSNGLDQYLIRLNNAGDTLWTKRIGTPNTDNIESIALVNNCFVLAGNTNTFSTGDDGYIVKTDTLGNVIWSKSYGGSLPDDFHSIRSTSDGGFVLCGTTRSYGQLNPNIWLFKTNSSGDSLWARTYGGDNHDHGYCAEETGDGGYILVGYSGSFGWNYEDAMVIKTGSDGVAINKLKYTTVIPLLQPSPSVCGSPNTQIRLVIRNFGDVTVPNIPITVQISGSLNTTINYVYPFAVVPGESDTVTLPTTINTSGIGTYTFLCYTSNNNDVFPLRNSFTSTFTMEGYSPAPQTSDQSRCGNGSLHLTASASTPAYWYDVPSGGSVIYTGNIYTTPVLSSTTTYYVQTGVNCPSSRIPVVAFINASSVDPVTNSTQNCGPGDITFSANSQDTVTWYDAPAGGNVVTVGNSFTLPLTVTTTYYAQTGSGVCLSNRIPCVAYIYPASVDPVTTSAQLCGPGTATLNASSPHSIVWYNTPTGGGILGSGPSFIAQNVQTTTTYYAQSFNANCASARIPAVVEILTLPNVYLGNDTLISGSTTFQIDAGHGFNSYAWSTGESTPSIVVNGPDTYCVTVTDASNCSNTDCIYIDFSTSIASEESFGYTSVYPNPATDKCYLTLPLRSIMAEVQLLDLNGKILRSMPVQEKTSIDLSAYAKGIYFLKIKTETFTEIQKLIVQ